MTVNAIRFWQPVVLNEDLKVKLNFKTFHYFGAWADQYISFNKTELHIELNGNRVSNKIQGCGWKTALKVLSFVTILLPLIALISKGVYKYYCHQHLPSPLNQQQQIDCEDLKNDDLTKAEEENSPLQNNIQEQLEETEELKNSTPSNPDNSILSHSSSVSSPAATDTSSPPSADGPPPPPSQPLRPPPAKKTLAIPTKPKNIEAKTTSTSKTPTDTFDTQNLSIALSSPNEHSQQSVEATNKTQKTPTSILPRKWSIENDKLLLEQHHFQVSTCIMTDSRNHQSLFLDKIVSNTPGFGTAAVRATIKASIDKGCEGHYHTDASWSSHLFHLYMGMIPADKNCDFIEAYFGTSGNHAIKAYNSIKKQIEIGAELTEKEKCQIETLKEIIAYVKNYDDDEYLQIAEKMSDHEVIENQALIEKLKGQNVSYLKSQFIPRLLDILKRDNTKRPDTSSLWQIRMELSVEGLERWIQTIKEEKEFVPFRKLEHLRPFMSEQQLASLDSIMQKRENL